MYPVLHLLCISNKDTSGPLCAFLFHLDATWFLIPGACFISGRATGPPLVTSHKSFPPLLSRIKQRTSPEQMSPVLPNQLVTATVENALPLYIGFKFLSCCDVLQHTNESLIPPETCSAADPALCPHKWKGLSEKRIYGGLHMQQTQAVC